MREMGQVASSKYHLSRITHYLLRLPYRIIALLLFLAALLPRLPGLNLFLTSDEKTNIYITGSNVIAAFLRGDFRGTYWHFYPGVTMSWLDAIGMAGQYGLDLLLGKPVPPFTEYIYGDILSLVVANRLPYAMLTALAVPAIYLLARRLLLGRVAALGALFLAFDPFYLAHSRVAHGDAPVAVFMSLSALAFFVYLKQINISQQVSRPVIFSSFTRSVHPSSFLITSAIFGGLAALTKAPGPFMALFVVGLSIFYALIEIRNDGIRNPQAARRIIQPWLLVIITWGLVSLAVFILLWPSMWVDSLGTIRQMWTETFGKVEAGHLVYFFGQATLDPGPWFYPYVIPFRLTPIILIGSFLSLVFLVLSKTRLLSKLPSATLLPCYSATCYPATLSFWLFTITLLLFGILSPKKQDRYLLPLFPFLNLLAAVGWCGVYNLLKAQIANSKLQITNSKFLLSTCYLLFPSLVFLQALPVFAYYPYYLTYFNPLMGGPTRAVETTLMGWGEGLEQAAAYLNTRPNAQNLYVASTPSQTLLPYFVGKGENFYTNDIAFRADYVVLYVTQMQRLAPSPEIVRYFEAQEPEKIITIHGVTYAKIYRNTPLILTDIPADATPVNTGFGDVLRLAGYHIEQAQNQLKVDLFWHALPGLDRDHGPCNEITVENVTSTVCPRLDYTMSVRLVSPDGKSAAHHDSWPVNGLLPTSQWRVNDYVRDRHTLALPPDLPPGAYRLAVVVYQAQSQAVLGGPVDVTGVQLGVK